MRKPRSARARLVIILLVAAYLIGYLVMRATRTETWERDGRAYVIFPAGAAPLYYLYRPLSYLDQALTGTGAHVGPHQ